MFRALIIFLYLLLTAAGWTLVCGVFYVGRIVGLDRITLATILIILSIITTVEFLHCRGSQALRELGKYIRETPKGISPVESVRD